MNDKEKLFRSIVEAAASSSSYACCGKQDITAEDIYGKSRKVNVSLARNIAVSLLIAFGFTISSCSIMLNRTTPAIRNMIREHKTPQIDGLIYSSSGDTMMSMDACLARLHAEGKITEETALQYASNPEMLSRKLK